MSKNHSHNHNRKGSGAEAAARLEFNRMLALNLVLGILIAIGGLCYDTILHNLVMKTIASSCFVLLCGINLAYGMGRVKSLGIHGRLMINGRKTFAWIMLTAFLFCLVADIILEIEFMYGALIFAAGHVCFLAAYCRLQPVQAKDFLPSVLIFLFAAPIILFLPIFDFGGMVMQMVCLFYALIISLMLGKAISNYRRHPDAVTLCILIGSCMFFFSDFMLLFEQFAQVPSIIGSLCVNSYYPAQAVLAHGVYRAGLLK